MSTISSSKSQISNHGKSDYGAGKGGQRTGNSFYDSTTDDSTLRNPFTAPPEDQIFSFKEEEKQKKQEEKEKNKSLKIWEKNRPTREGCLRKLGETDIEPSALAINPKV